MQLMALAAAYQAGVGVVNYLPDWNPKNIPLEGWLVIAVVIGLFVVPPIFTVARRRFSGASKIRGPALTGTARILTVEHTGSIPSGADLLASGQRVPGVLMSFAANGGNTDSTYSRPELRGAPFYVLTIELHIPNLAPMTARNIQPVPLAMVPKLALGLPLTCAVDPANPANLFTVDWGNIAY